MIKTSLMTDPNAKESPQRRASGVSAIRLGQALA